MNVCTIRVYSIQYNSSWVQLYVQNHISSKDCKDGDLNVTILQL